MLDAIIEYLITLIIYDAINIVKRSNSSQVNFLAPVLMQCWVQTGWDEREDIFRERCKCNLVCNLTRPL